MWKRIKAGWRVAGEGHPGVWLWIKVFALPALGAAFPVWLTRDAIQHRGIVLALGSVVWAALFLCVLFYEGGKKRKR